MEQEQEFIKRKIQSLKDNKQFQEWNQGNKLSDQPLLLFHGTYDDGFDEIELSTGSDNNHFSNGLHLSNNINEINNFYAKDLNLDKKELSHLDVYAKLDLFMESFLDIYRNKDAKDIFLEKFKLTNKVKNIIENINVVELEENDIFFIEELLDIAKKELTEQEFFESFKIKKSNINNFFDFEKDELDHDKTFTFLKNMYLQNEGLILPFFLKSEKPLYCIDSVDAENENIPCSRFFIFEEEYDIKDEDANTKKYLQDIYNDINNKFDINDLDSVFNEFKENIDNSINDGEYVADIFKMVLERYIEDEDNIENCVECFQNLILEDDIFVYYSNQEELNRIHKEHQDFLKLKELASNHLNDYDFKNFNKKVAEITSGHYLYSISVRDFLYNLEQEDVELKREITHNLFPKMYDVAIFHANFEFAYLKDENKQTLHYLVYNSENVKYAFNKTFDPDNHKLSARRVSEKTDMSISDEDIDAVIAKIHKVYPYYPKIINHEYKENTVAEFNHDSEEIHLYRKNVTSQAELMKTLLHEYVIHYGLHKTLGDKGKELLLSAYDYMDKNNLLNDVKDKYPEFNTNTDEGKCLLAEEKLAFMSEEQLFKKDSFLDNICYKLKKLFHQVKESLGIGHMEDKIFLTIDTINENLKIQNDFQAHHDYTESIESKVKNNTKKKLKFT